MTVTPYLNMDGNAEEALEFYQGIFGGTSDVMRWSDMPPDPQMPVEETWKDKLMHAELTISDTMKIYLADSWMGKDTPVGGSVFLHVEFDSEEDLRKTFAALSNGGSVNMPVGRMFWGAVYGDVVDRYGIGWGLHYQLPD